MHGTPVTTFEDDWPANIESLAPARLSFDRVDAPVTHTFTHFDLELQVYVAHTKRFVPKGLEGEWAPLSKLASFALPTLFRKVLRAAISSQPGPMKKGRRSP